MTVGKLAWTTALAFAGLMLVAQLVPIKGISNAPSIGAFPAPPRIEATLKRACYDCHSNQTRWPWYSRVAPVSWLMVHDVSVARREVNFSEWGSYYPATRRRKLEWIDRSLHEEKMPPWSYRVMHPGARLTPADKLALEEWIESALATPLAARSKELR